MEICITGGSGFIGSALVRGLVGLGHSVSVIDCVVGDTNPCVKLHLVDIRNLMDVPLPQPDVIVHLAAVSRIPVSITNPKYTYEVNSCGTINILEYARCLKKIPKIIYAGSNSAYHDVYSNHYVYSKWLGEEHCKLYNKLYGLPYAITRFFNVYGSGENSSTVIGAFKKLTSEHKPLCIIGDGLQRRDFTNVQDVVDGLILLIQSECFAGDIFDFGTGRSYSILDIAHVFGGDIEFLPARLQEAQDLVADIDKSQNLLNYCPRYNVKEYINEWMKTL